MIAPLAISSHIELIILIFEYMATPNVAAKKPSALTSIEGIDVASAVVIESCYDCPANLSVLYLDVISIA